MGFLDKAKQMATKENLEKAKKQAQEKIDQAQDKINKKPEQQQSSKPDETQQQG